MAEQENTNEVIAWRLTAVEEAVRDVSAKLDNMVKGFATHKDIEVAKQQAKAEHRLIYEKIDELEREVRVMKRKSWVQNTLSAALGVLLTLLITYVITDLLK